MHGLSLIFAFVALTHGSPVPIVSTSLEFGGLAHDIKIVDRRANQPAGGSVNGNEAEQAHNLVERAFGHAADMNDEAIVSHCDLCVTKEPQESELESGAGSSSAKRAPSVQYGKAGKARRDFVPSGSSDK